MDLEAPPAATAPPTPAPNWATVEREIECPLCRYNLRGLVEPRCPECGYRFDWDELLHPERLLQQYLFESRPEHNARAFFHTLLRSLRAKQFWSMISPSQRASASRLTLYWLIAAIPAVAGIAASAVWAARSYWGLDLSNALMWLLMDLFQPDRFTRANIDLGHGMMLVLMILLAWPWLTFAALNVFIQSMARVRIDSVHVLRCVMYTAGVTFLAGVVTALIASGLLALNVGWTRMDNLGMPLFAAAVLLLWGWLTHRLIIAYRLYLRFHRPVATVLASQVIVALAALTILLWSVFFPG